MRVELQVELRPQRPEPKPKPARDPGYRSRGAPSPAGGPPAASDRPGAGRRGRHRGRTFMDLAAVARACGVSRAAVSKLVGDRLRGNRERRPTRRGIGGRNLARRRLGLFYHWGFVGAIWTHTRYGIADCAGSPWPR